MTTQTCFYIFAAGLALAAVAHAESANEASYAEATSFVQVFMAEHATAQAQGDSACKKVASDSIKEIQQECDAQQDLIKKARAGSKHCCKSGQTAICSAEKALKASQGKVADCGKSIKTLKAQPVNFEPVPFQQLEEGNCAGGSFFGSAYQKIKGQVKAQELKCEKIKGEINASKAARDQAQLDQAKARKTCKSGAKDALSKVFNNAEKICQSDKNAKAYKRAKHMLCILAGKTLQDCSTDKPPTVTKGEMQQQACPRLFCSKKCKLACAKVGEVFSFAQGEAVEGLAVEGRRRWLGGRRRGVDRERTIKEINHKKNERNNKNNERNNKNTRERNTKKAKRDKETASKKLKKDQLECGCSQGLRL